MRSLKKDKKKTVVVFRKFSEGDLIAFFPQESWEDQNTGEVLISSYQKIGQHSAASPSLIEELLPVSKEERRELKEELKGLGYNLQEGESYG